MSILDRLKEVVDPSHTDDPAVRAQHIIAELVQPLDKPNQVIINDIVSLIYALSQNPDSTIDLDEVVTTAKILIDELIKPIPKPNRKLADELLLLIVSSSPHKRDFSSSNAPAVKDEQAKPASASGSDPRAAQTPAASKSDSAPSQASATVASASAPTTAKAPASGSAPAPAAAHSNTEQISQSVVKLLTEEIKEMLKKHQALEQYTRDSENKQSNKLTVINDDLYEIKNKLKVYDGAIEEMARSLDKFIGLYEIIINQYNPFVEQVPQGAAAAPSASPSAIAQATPTPAPAVTPPQTPASAPSAAQKPASPNQSPVTGQTTPTPVQDADASAASSQSSKASSPSTATPVSGESALEHVVDLAGLIEKVKGLSDEDYATLSPSLPGWVNDHMHDAALADQIKQAAKKVDVIKILIKKSLKLSMES